MRAIRHAVKALCVVALLGLAGSPQVHAVPVFDPCFEGCITLKPGSNLVSFRRLPENPSIEAVFGDVAKHIVAIQGDGVVALRLSDGSFAGNALSLERTRGYWITTDLAAPADVPLLGEWTDPDLKYNLRQGKTLISFPCETEIPVEDAFKPDDLNKILDIQGQGMVAMKLPNGKWAGSLTKLEPHKGYWINLAEKIPHFSFVCPGSDAKSPYTYGCTDGGAKNFDGEATIDDGTCKYDMPADWVVQHDADQSHYILHDIRLGKEYLPLSKKDLLAVFDADGKVLGYGTAVGPYATVTAYAAPANAALTFGVYRANTGQVEAIETLPKTLIKEPGAALGGCGIKAATNYFPDAQFGIGNCMVTASCVGKAEGDACNDGSACTLTDACTAEGFCVGSGNGCEDNNSCTSTECFVDGQCGVYYLEGACDDGDPCTEADLCIEGNCGGKAVTCPDGQICVDGGCEDAVADPDDNDAASGPVDEDVNFDIGPELDASLEDLTSSDVPQAPDTAMPPDLQPADTSSVDTGSEDLAEPLKDTGAAVDTASAGGETLSEDDGCAGAPVAPMNAGLAFLFAWLYVRGRSRRGASLITLRTES